MFVDLRIQVHTVDVAEARCLADRVASTLIDDPEVTAVACRLGRGDGGLVSFAETEPEPWTPEEA